MKPTTTIGIALLLTAGCTTTKNYYSNDSLAPLPTTGDPTTIPFDNTDTSIETEFVNAVYDLEPLSSIIPETVIIETGWATCEAFDNGATANDLAEMMANEADNDLNAGKVMAAISGIATVYLCPEYADAWSE